MISACKAAKVTTVLTSRAFIEKGRLDKLIEALSPVVRIIYLEDVRAGIGSFDKLRGLLAGKRRARGARTGRSGRDPVHLGFGGNAERASSSRIATS